MKIPIIVGVTGHRDLRPQDEPFLREAVRAELEALKNEYAHSEFVMLDSIAAGADSLCAEEALKLGFRLVCPLPMEESEYRRDFSAEELDVFERLLEQAGEVFVAPHSEDAQDGRDYCYRQAGIYVAAHSHVLLALWDGSDPKPNGCGTAEAVDFMLRGVGSAGGCFHAENDGAVIHVSTPRQSGNGDLPIRARLIENRKGSLREVLKNTDQYNAEAVGNAETPIPEGVHTDAVTKKPDPCCGSLPARS